MMDRQDFYKLARALKLAKPLYRDTWKFQQWQDTVHIISSTFSTHINFDAVSWMEWIEDEGE